MPSVLLERTEPTDEVLRDVLGAAKAAWDALLAHLAREHPALEVAWKYYGAKHGWQMKAASGKRSILYLFPQEGSFLAALALDDRATETLATTKLPKALVEEITNAKPATEGRPARVLVKTKKDLAHVEVLLALKLAPRSKKTRA